MDNERVLMKIVTGRDGVLASQFAKSLKHAWPLDAEKVYALAISMGFGHADSLVVMTPEETVFKGEGELGKLYRDTFCKPTFNPRWENGSAECTVIVRVRRFKLKSGGHAKAADHTHTTR